MQPEAEFVRDLRAAFQVEAAEHLQAISAGILELEKKPASERLPVLIESVYREVHSLKGAARVVNMPGIEALCQAMESVFSRWKQGRALPPTEVFDVLYQGVDQCSQMLSHADAAAPGQISELVRRIAALPDSPAADAPRADRDAARSVQQAPAAPAEEDKGLTAADTVRIAVSKLDALLTGAEELLSVKLTTGQRAAHLRETMACFESWKREWGRLQPAVGAIRQKTGHPAQAADPDLDGVMNFLAWNQDTIKAWEERLRGLTRTAEQDYRVAGALVGNLLAESKDLLMLPCASALGGLPKLVRDLCRDQGKKADLIVRGAEVEIDKRILEAMKDPLMHLARNCVDHGIELPSQRERNHKPARAAITLAIAQCDSGKVEIVVSDDGGGIDTAEVKRAAVRNGVLSAAAAEKLTERERLDLVFESGVSTRHAVSEISGRGLGLAIVRQKTEELGGRVSVATVRGKGTTFRVLLPLALATFRGILVESGGQMFVLPVANLERVARVRFAEIRTVENREAVTLADRVLSLARLDSILGLPRVVNPGATATDVVVLSAGDQQLALAVDAVLREEEVLAKKLGSPLSRVRNIAGATVLGAGAPVPILSATDLMKSALIARAPQPPAGAVAKAAVTSRRSVLVVEDSMTARMLLKGILESAGYQVRTAVDGFDAWMALSEHMVDLVVSDVDMPRMNGLALTARIRGDKKMNGLPVVLVTALASAEDRARGVDVGAYAYIVKSTFDQSNLLGVVKRLIGP